MEWNDRSGVEKKPYYVSVQAMQVLADPEAAAYELEIVASHEDVLELQQFLNEMNSIDLDRTAHSLWNIFEPVPNSKVLNEHDLLIQKIYRKLYECGTTETKQHIESMHIL